LASSAWHFDALSGHELFFGSGEFVHAAVARSAGRLAERGVDAGGESLGLIRMAGGALDFDNFGGMGKLFDVGVAVLAAEDAVRAGRMFGRIDRNALAGAGLHSRLAMAGETLLVFTFIGALSAAGAATPEVKARVKSQGK